LVAFCHTAKLTVESHSGQGGGPELDGLYPSKPGSQTSAEAPPAAIAKPKAVKAGTAILK
jgi:hypothetical protein